MRIGILAVQGAFIEHEKQIAAVAEHFGEQIECIEIRQKKDLEKIDGIILPGGESTVQGKLLKDLDIFDELQSLIIQGLPTLATCAGLILLAQTLENDSVKHLATLPVTVQRNAYGRQLGSFSVTSNVGWKKATEKSRYRLFEKITGLFREINEELAYTGMKLCISNPLQSAALRLRRTEPVSVPA